MKFQNGLLILSLLNYNILWSSLFLHFIFLIIIFMSSSSTSFISVFTINVNNFYINLLLSKTTFSIIMLGPFAYYYFKGNISRFFLGLAIILLMLLIESRTGLILAFLQFILLIIFRYYLSIKSVFIVGLLTFFLVLPFFNESTRNNIADFILKTL